MRVGFAAIFGLCIAAGMADKRALYCAPEDPNCRNTGVQEEMQQNLDGGGGGGADPFQCGAPTVTNGFCERSSDGRQAHCTCWDGLKHSSLMISSYARDLVDVSTCQWSNDGVCSICSSDPTPMPDGAICSAPTTATLNTRPCKCAPWYIFTDTQSNEFSMSCYDDIGWQAVAGYCEYRAPPDCGVYSPGGASCSFDANMQTADCSCDTGVSSYTGTAQFTSTCNPSTLQWEDKGGCTSCYGGPSIENAVCSENSAGVKSCVCYPRYAFADGSSSFSPECNEGVGWTSLECIATGEEIPPTSCTNPDIYGANCNVGAYFASAECQCESSRRYTINGQTNFHLDCQADSTWGAVGTCTSCHPDMFMPTVSNAVCTPTGDYTSMTCVCNTGYSITGAKGDTRFIAPCDERDGWRIHEKCLLDPQEYCGDGRCNNNEDCNTCAGDCGACAYCGDGVCNGGENCNACAMDCGVCTYCGDDRCDAGETCESCSRDCGGCPIMEYCGDGKCNKGETCESCKADCGECVSCGDGRCSSGESCESCSMDCGPCPYCGDGRCNNGETCDSCSQDCGFCQPTQYCGDGQCNNGEDCTSCALDCGPCYTYGFCGDYSCNNGETCQTCSQDCGSCSGYCGDGTCSGDETCNSCSQDCGPCAYGYCGDYSCNNGETCESCSQDCGMCQYCGDGSCNNGETCDSCSQDCGMCPYCGDGQCNNGETCDSCGIDCGSCYTPTEYCGDGTCNNGEDCMTCSQDCGSCSTTEYCGDGVCNNGEDFISCSLDCQSGSGSGCGDNYCDTWGGEDCNSCSKDCGSCGYCGDGSCNSDETCDSCSQDCGTCPMTEYCGDGSCNNGETCDSCNMDCGACPYCGDGSCNGSENCDSCSMDCGSCTTPTEYCGDGSCNNGENCSSCSSDCGSCGYCGDYTCNSDEDCHSCSQDCGDCPTTEYCGDGSCNSDETCDSCSQDCGPCGYCGDSQCNNGEDCSTCSGDCGPCETCGNGVCGYMENCTNCPGDCGECDFCGDGRCSSTEDCKICPNDCGKCSPTPSVTASVTASVTPSVTPSVSRLCPDPTCPPIDNAQVTLSGDKKTCSYFISSAYVCSCHEYDNGPEGGTARECTCECDGHYKTSINYLYEDCYFTRSSIVDCSTAVSVTPTRTPTSTTSTVPTRSVTATTTPSVTPTTTPSTVPTPSTTATQTPTTTPTRSPTTTPSPSMSPSASPWCVSINLPDAKCTVKDSVATCKCNKGVYSETMTPEFTATCSQPDGWAITGNCYSCEDPGNPFYSTRIGETYDTTQTQLLTITHNCSAGYWNALDKQPTVTSTCQRNGFWTPMIQCSQCRVPKFMAHNFGILNVTHPLFGKERGGFDFPLIDPDTGVVNNRAARILERASVDIDGFFPAYKLHIWCHMMTAPTMLVTAFDPTYNRSVPVFPAVSTCSNEDGKWSNIPSCINCRVQSNRRRCSNIAYCSRASCRFGPWTPPQDLYNITLYT